MKMFKMGVKLASPSKTHRTDFVFTQGKLQNKQWPLETVFRKKLNCLQQITIFE